MINLKLNILVQQEISTKLKYHPYYLSNVLALVYLDVSADYMGPTMSYSEFDFLPFNANPTSAIILTSLQCHIN